MLNLRRWKVIRIDQDRQVIVSRHWSRGAAMAVAILADQVAQNRDRGGNLLRLHWVTKG